MYNPKVEPIKGFNKLTKVQLPLFFTFILLLIYHTQLYSQESKRAEILPPSPTAAALGKYGDIPISYYTGVPNINIPLHTITVGEIEVPISLSYHASGIKVEEMASNVGLGWSLNAGGVITRSVRSRPDEMGYFTTMEKLIEYDADGTLATALSKAAYLTEREKAAKDLFWVSENNDFEPDMFFLNFPGQSGKFVFNSERQPLLIPFSKLRVEPTFAAVTGSLPEEPVFLANNGNYTAGFKLTNTRGIEYTFNTLERSVTKSGVGADLNEEHYVSSWYLSEIKTPRQKESVEFIYEEASTFLNQDIRTNFTKLVTRPLGHIECSTDMFSESYSQLAHLPQRLKEIRFSGGKLVFHANTGRLDIPNEVQLDSIEVFYGEKRIKTFTFEYSYFQSLIDDEHTGKRLRLERVTEWGMNGGSKPPYVFGYNVTKLPSRTSSSQDHWGYFNNAGNTNLIPSFRDWYNNLVQGANREPNPSNMKAGVLERILYPTGGYTEFEFEAHDYFSDRKATSTRSETIVAEHPDPLTTSDGQTSVCVICEPQTTTTFTVVDPEPGSMLLKPTIAFPENTEVSLEDLNISVYKDGALLFRFSKDSQTPTWHYLQAGEYTVVATAKEPGSRVRLAVEWKEFTGGILLTEAGGGLRIKRITNFSAKPGEKPLIKEYEYRKPNNAQKSSGYLVSGLPIYSSYYQNNICVNGPTSSENSCAYYECVYLKLSSSSQSFLGSSHGSPVVYDFVTELIGENGQGGKKEYYYSYVPNKSLVQNAPVNQTPTDMDWQRGYLQKEVSCGFNKQTNTFFPLQEVVSDYIFLEDNESYPSLFNATYAVTKGIKYELVEETADGMPGIYGNGGIYKYAFYEDISAWNFLQKTTTKRYFPQEATAEAQKVVEYYYDNPAHLQLTRKYEENSKGDQIATILRYPDDEPYSTAEVPILMQQMNMISLPVEKQTWLKTTLDDSLLLHGQLIIRRVHDGLVLEGAVDRITLDSPVAPTANQLAGLYQPYEHYLYNDEGRLVEIRKENVSSSFIWYKDLLVAQAENAQHTKIYFTSFEEEGNYEQTRVVNDGPLSFSGERFYEGDLSINLSNAEAEDYLLTYYWKDLIGDAWEYEQNLVNHIGGNLAVSVTKGQYIDEVRLYPAKARLTTYTYKKGVGITTLTDENGQAHYYEYDEHGRLKNIRDPKKSILKNHQYHYGRSN